MTISTSRQRTVLGDILATQGRRQGWLARHLRVSDSLLSRMLSGEKRCSSEQAGIIAGVLGVPVASFYRDGEFVISIDIVGIANANGIKEEVKA